MRVLCVISEYNPFHNGHRLHISSARGACDYVIAVMSGNFVQRGEPALVDKYLRTRMALLNGADMVIELPVYFAAASAEYFAHNAVKLLNASGVAGVLAFGSESGALAPLSRLADALAAEDAGYKSALKSGLAGGLNYPRARAKALAGLGDAPDAPNDILAVEYLKALKRTGSGIKPLAVRRVGAGYHDKDITGDIASATAIRRAVSDGEPGKAEAAMPPSAWALLSRAYSEGCYVPGLDAYAGVFRHILRTNPRLDETMDISEGLHHRFIEMSGKFSAPSEIISAVKTKRYTRTRLNRAALHMLLGIRRTEFEYFNALETPPYIRVLGLRKSAGGLMKALTANAACPVITLLRPAARVLSADGLAMLEKEIVTTDIYYAGMRNGRPVEKGAEYGAEFVSV